MKTFCLYALLFFTLINMTAAQTSLTGTWIRPPAADEYFEYEGLIFAEDGYFYAEAVYTQYTEYLMPEFSLGVYQFDGSSLKLYDMKEDKYLNYTVSNFNGRQFRLCSLDNGQCWVFSYRGSPEIDENIQNKLISWENYRRLGGAWRSEESVVKFVPSLGVIIIRSTTDPNYFLWGHYSLNGNFMEITEISAEQAVIYQGTIAEFERDGFTITNSDGPEYFSFQGNLNLDSHETMMLQQYMMMNHRLSMSAIDMMDGVQDFIWKRVKE